MSRKPRVWFDQSCQAVAARFGEPAPSPKGGKYRVGDPGGKPRPDGPLTHRFQIACDGSYWHVDFGKRRPKWRRIPVEGAFLKVSFEGQSGRAVKAQAGRREVGPPPKGEEPPDNPHPFDLHKGAHEHVKYGPATVGAAQIGADTGRSRYMAMSNGVRCCWVKLGNNWYCLPY